MPAEIHSSRGVSPAGGEAERPDGFDRDFAAVGLGVGFLAMSDNQSCGGGAQRRGKGEDDRHRRLLMQGDAVEPPEGP